MEKVIHSFLPWESITKSLSSHPEPEYDEDSSDDETEKKSVKFEESDDESDDSPPKLTFSDEVATIDIEELDKVEKVDDDPMKDIEKKMGESLVLKL